MRIGKIGEQGFSLMELLVTVAVLAILAAIAIPIYLGYVTASKKSEAKSNLTQIKALEEQYFQEYGTYVAGKYKAGDTSLGNLPPTNIGFQPGAPEDLNFEYEVTVNGNTFTATATAKWNNSVVFTIDQNNNKTGDW